MQMGESISKLSMAGTSFKTAIVHIKELKTIKTNCSNEYYLHKPEFLARISLLYFESKTGWAACVFCIYCLALSTYSCCSKLWESKAATSITFLQTKFSLEPMHEKEKKFFVRSSLLQYFVQS